MSPAEQGAADLEPDRQMIDPRSNQQLAGRMTDGTDYFSIADNTAAMFFYVHRGFCAPLTAETQGLVI
jgi:hypothetical protein